MSGRCGHHSTAFARHSRAILTVNAPHSCCLQFAVDELLTISRALLSNSTRRREISDGMKAFFRDENQRAMAHVRVELHRALDAATELKGQPRDSMKAPPTAAP